MRSHGWSGNAPASDGEAIDRILDAAGAMIAEPGSTVRIADVARSLGVTRQTVYRYFPGTDALLISVAMRSADGFLDQLARHIQGLTDPLAAMVESMAFSVENLAGDERIRLLLSEPGRAGTTVSLTGETAIAFGRGMLRRFDVDWASHGFDDRDVDELAEFTLRLLHSYLVDRGPAPHDGAQLRRFLARWVGPALVRPHEASVVRG
ncbi:TetR/AcrR family transcriptional regulator [Gordonia sp. NPDC058843]|uniref:TetR/AcrR family transcriptional regulator n=1 Tax=Gordonia sp. NPDC058843 TaxID=3346648 RepID=UPI0036A4A05B